MQPIIYIFLFHPQFIFYGISFNSIFFVTCRWMKLCKKDRKRMELKMRGCEKQLEKRRGNKL